MDAGLRLGLRLISGLSAGHAEVIEQARQRGKFRSLDDFSRRTRLGPGVLRRLAAADALTSLERDRRSALWEVLGQGDARENLPLFAETAPADAPRRCSHDPPHRSPCRRWGCTSRSWPTTKRRGSRCGLIRCVSSEKSSHGWAWSLPRAWRRLAIDRSVRVAGLVLVRQRPATASGITFVTLEDETGTANLIVRPDVWRRFFEAASRATILVAHGRLQRQGEIVHVLAERLEDFSPAGGNIASRSRDFR